LKENEDLKQENLLLRKQLLGAREEAESLWYMLEEIRRAEEEIATQLEKELNEMVIKTLPTVGDA